MKKKLSGGVVHELPTDLENVLNSFPKARDEWEKITPLSRNEWICWVESAKKLETRERKIGRVETELMEGKHRPCCWPGCIHRTDKVASPSQKFVWKVK